MEATEVEHQIEGALNRVAEARDVALLEGARGARARGIATRQRQGFGNHIDPRDLPAVLGEIDAVGARSTAEVQRTGRRKWLGTFDQVDQVRRRRSPLPDRQPSQIERAVDQGVPALTSERIPQRSRDDQHGRTDHERTCAPGQWHALTTRPKSGP